MNKELPLYEMRINPKEKALVDAIALVEEPAIESDFMFFDKQLRIEFKHDEEKMELMGYAMIPDLKIYRRDKDGFEYNVVFSKETIRNIAKAFFQNGYQANMNLHHTVTPAASYVFQSYIVDTDKGIVAPTGLESINGGWIVGVKVEDKKVWEEIKAGKVKGFSVEGLFAPVEVTNENEQSIDEEILSLLNQINNKIEKKK